MTKGLNGVGIGLSVPLYRRPATTHSSLRYQASSHASSRVPRPTPHGLVTTRDRHYGGALQRLVTHQGMCPQHSQGVTKRACTTGLPRNTELCVRQAVTLAGNCQRSRTQGNPRSQHSLQSRHTNTRGGTTEPPREANKTRGAR